MCHYLSIPMQLNPHDKKRLHDFYKKGLEEYGENDARALQWADRNNQLLRFEILLNIGNVEGTKILDVGCGLGDFYKYLLEKQISVEYTGIDIVPEYITLSTRKYPDALFLCQDIFEVNENYDYIFCSGSLNFKVENHTKYNQEVIKKMFDISNRGVAFNMLDRSTHIDNETYSSYNPDHIADYCKTLCNRVEIVIGNLPQDFTIYLYKD